ncbi:hypothetical protein IFM89_015170 [Coptis chinensis]|uniref:Uncharacterized protein n=1 Tax=Coptis chinensis TaxID=261450 RepID=A0A835H0Y3_9MAGN|nr:hypothetical protein IFM89_015170 [Coptis chinensis]
MASKAIEAHKENAEIYHGAEICKQKAHQILSDNSLPKGLLPLDDMTEVGYNPSTGFIWMKQKKCTIHFFRSLNQTVWYGHEITTFIENGRMKKLTGIKAKELVIWISTGEIYINKYDTEKISFKNNTIGVSRTFPVAAFDLKEEY